MPSQNPNLPARSRPGSLAPQHLLVAAFWGGFFCWLNRLPLQSSELWGQASYGKWILANQALPAEDPFLPLSAGMRLFDTAWLTQTSYAAVHAWGGVEAMSALFAIVVVAAHAVLGRAFFLQTRSLLATHLGVLAVVGISSSRLTTANPDAFGMLCFAVLLWLLARERGSQAEPDSGDPHPTRIRWALWLGVPSLLALWANVHGSFICGLLVLLCWLVGAVAEAAGRERSVRGVVEDPAVRRWMWLGELALAAACVNPYGVRLVLYCIWFADFRPLQELPGWEPLALLQPGGLELLVSLLLGILIFRFSPRRLPVADWLLVAALAFVFGAGVRMAWWYAAVFGFVVTPHLAAIGRRWRDGLACRCTNGDGTARRGWLPWDARPGLSYTAMSLGVFWICFALAPAWEALVWGHSRPPERLYAVGTPWKLTKHLRENPPQGQVFHPHWWGDWLIWDGPAGLRPFLTTNLHLLPPKVSIDYRIMRETRTGWENVMLRYGVQTVILDRHRQKTLLRYLSGADQWEQQYEDEWCVVLAQAAGKPSIDRAGEETEQGVSLDE